MFLVEMDQMYYYRDHIVTISRYATLYPLKMTHTEACYPILMQQNTRYKCSVMLWGQESSLPAAGAVGPFYSKVAGGSGVSGPGSLGL